LLDQRGDTAVHGVAIADVEVFDVTAGNSAPCTFEQLGRRSPDAAACPGDDYPSPGS